MTVNTTSVKSGPYPGNDFADEFSYGFRIENKTQLIVYETDDTGVVTTLILDTDYTVAGVGVDGGGTVTRTAGPLPTNYEWLIVADYKGTQLTAFNSQGGFFPDVHEDALDKLTFLIQQNAEELSRAMLVPVTDTTDPSDLYDGLVAILETGIGGSGLVLNFDHFTADGFQSVFTLSIAPPNAASLLVTIDGIEQNDDDYSVVGKTLTFFSIPSPGVEIVSRNLGNQAQVVSPFNEVRYLSNYTTWADAISMAGVQPVTLVVDIAYPIAVSVVIPATMSLQWNQGCVITGVNTLTINGDLTAGEYQLFGSDVTVVGLSEASPTWWGALPSGTEVSNTSAIQSAIDSGAKVIELHDIFPATTVNVDKPCRIFSKGGGGLTRVSVTPTEMTPVLFITSSDVDIDNIAVTGTFDNTGTKNDFDTAILVQGDNTPTQIERVNVTNCKISKFRGFGIWVRYTSTSRIENNDVFECGSVGIAGASLIHGIITKNRVKDIGDLSGASPIVAAGRYGITLSRDPAISLANAARSTNCIITNNIVSNVWQWTGIDSHAPLKAIITDNQVYYCRNGIYAQYDSASEPFKQPAEDVIIARNIVQGRITPSENSLGLASLGLSTMPNNNIVISDNMVTGCGSYDDTNGSVYINHSINTEVRRNKLVKSIRHCLSLKGVSDSVIVSDNIIDGVIDGNIANNRSYLFIESAGLTNISIARNRFRNTTGDTSYNGHFGIWYVGSSTEIVMDANRMETPDFSYLYDGATNNYDDLVWVLENVSASANFNLNPAVASEFLIVPLRREIFGGSGVHKIFTVSNGATFVSFKIAMSAVVYTSSSIQVTAYTNDGTTFGGAYLVSPMVSVSAVCWAD